MGQEEQEDEEDEKETDHHDDDDNNGGGCCIGGGAHARAGAHDPSQVWVQRGRARGRLASSACDIVATRGIRDTAREIVQLISPETSWQLWTRR